VRGQIERTGRELSRHVDHPLLHPELAGKGGDVVRHVVGDGVPHEGAEQHELDGTRAEPDVPTSQHRREFERRHERTVVERDGVIRHRRKQREDQRSLDGKKSLASGHGRREPVRQRLRLGGVGPLQVDRL